MPTHQMGARPLPVLRDPPDVAGAPTRAPREPDPGRRGCGAISGGPALTLDQLLARCRKAVWFYDLTGKIRTLRENVNTCPVNFVAGSTGTGFPYTNGKRVGLVRDDIDRVVAAADGRTENLRGPLLAACGLREKR